MVHLLSVHPNSKPFLTHVLNCFNLTWFVLNLDEAQIVGE